MEQRAQDSRHPGAGTAAPAAGVYWRTAAPPLPDRPVELPGLCLPEFRAHPVCREADPPAQHISQQGAALHGVHPALDGQRPHNRYARRYGDGLQRCGCGHTRCQAGRGRRKEGGRGPGGLPGTGGPAAAPAVGRSGRGQGGDGDRTAGRTRGDTRDRGLGSEGRPAQGYRCVGHLHGPHRDPEAGAPDPAERTPGSSRRAFGRDGARDTQSARGDTAVYGASRAKAG